MLKLLLRFFILFFLLSLITAFVLNHVYQIVKEKNALHNINFAENGIVQLLNRYLSPYPAERWQKILEEKNPVNRFMNIIPIGQTGLHGRDVIDLKKGEWVYQKKSMGTDVIYKKTPDLHYAYKFYTDSPAFIDAQMIFGIPQSIINTRLKSLPQNQWGSYINQISNEINIPISIHALNTLHLSSDASRELASALWTVDCFDNNCSRQSVFTLIPNTLYVVEYGPIKSQFLNHYETYIIFLCLFIFIEILALIAAFLFAHSLSKLNALADEYSQGNFKNAIKLNKFSILFPLFKNLKLMGNRIQLLVYSHKELSNAVAHELRTPISRLRFSLELLKDSKDPHQLDLRANAMEEDIIELEDLVSEILTYSQLDRLSQSIELETVSILFLLNSIVEKFKQDLVNKKIIINAPNEAENWMISVNTRYFKRALQNLIKNAIHFSKLTVRISLIKTDSAHCQLIIEDDGPGIPIDDRERVFEPFTQLKNQPSLEADGYGLGLAIVKKIIDQHHWGIKIIDSDLSGAKFIISIELVS